jgi:hypothetical protein
MISTPNKYPKCVAEIKPESISFKKTPAGELTMDLFWGKPFKPHHLIVGPPSIPIPPVGRIKMSKEHWMWRRPAKPGAYVIGFAR